MNVAEEVLVAYIRNNHIKEAGAPPGIDSGTVRYVSVFQNKHSEQWVFWVNEQRETFLAGGDIGWEGIKSVERAELVQIFGGYGIQIGPDKMEHTILMTMEEAMFVTASWHASRPAAEQRGPKAPESAAGKT